MNKFADLHVHMRLSGSTFPPVRKRLKILFIPSGGRISPATRYRVCQIIPFLEEKGIDCTVYSIFSEKITTSIIRSSTFEGLQKIIYYIRILIERFIRACNIISLADKFDMIFLQRTTFPLGLEKLLKAKNKNIVFDIDDPIYLPDKEEKGLIGRFKRYIKKREVVSILCAARCVIAENNYIKDFVQSYCKDVYLITGPIDTVKNFAKENWPDPKEVIIGWIGTPSTTPYLRMLDEVLRKLSRKYKIKVRLIGASPYVIEGVNTELINWDEETEVQELHKFDIGVMSMPDNEWTRGKVGCKMLQYMANAIPAVVSYTPTTSEVIEEGVNGFLVSSEEEWIEKLSLLIERADIREKIGMAGRKTVEGRFSLEVNIPKYVEIFRRCCGV